MEKDNCPSSSEKEELIRQTIEDLDDETICSASLRLEDDVTFYPENSIERDLALTNEPDQGFKTTKPFVFHPSRKLDDGSSIDQENLTMNEI